MAFSLATAGRVHGIEVGGDSTWTVSAGSVAESLTAGVVTISGSDVDAELRITDAAATALTVSGDRNRVDVAVTTDPAVDNAADVIVVSGIRTVSKAS